jgi:hypothetical protein
MRTLTDVNAACTMFTHMYTTGEIIRNPVADKREKLYADMQVTDIFNHLNFVYQLYFALHYNAATALQSIAVICYEQTLSKQATLCTFCCYLSAREGYELHDMCVYTIINTLSFLANLSLFQHCTFFHTCSMQGVGSHYYILRYNDCVCMLLHSLLLQVGSDYMFRVDEDTVVDATFKVKHSLSY